MFALPLYGGYQAQHAACSVGISWEFAFVAVLSRAAIRQDHLSASGLASPRSPLPCREIEIATSILELRPEQLFSGRSTYQLLTDVVARSHGSPPGKYAGPLHN